MKKEKKHHLPIEIITVIMTALIVYCGVLVFSYRNINKSLYEERSSNTLILMDKIAQNAQTGIKTQWLNLHHFENMFSEIEINDIENTVKELEKMRLHRPDEVSAIFLVDKDRNCFMSNGSEFRWGKPELLVTGEEECYISDTEMHITNDDTPLMFFLSPLESAVSIEDSEITHIGITVKMTFIDNFFDTSEYGEESVAFILRNTGRQIYKQKKSNSISNVFNVLSALENAEFLYDASHESLADDLKNGNSDCINVIYENKDYYIAYQSLELNNWMTLLMIPEDKIGNTGKEFMTSVVVSIVIIILGALILLAIIIWLGMQKVKRQRDEVQAQLIKAAEAERNANQAKTQFLSSMSHDIRTPMNAIIGMTSLAVNHIEDTEYVRSCLAKSMTASNHLLTLINDVLDISKVEAGQMSVNSIDFSLSDTFCNLSNIIYPQIYDKKQQFEMRIHNVDYEYVHADQLRLNQISINLLSNAVKYTNAGGRITVDIKQEKINDNLTRLIYIVEDNGIGMSEDFQKIMYESFSRVTDSRTNNIQGTGLGLAICKQMVDLLGGTIECESKVDVGTKFTVTLEFPLADKTVEKHLLPSVKILIVDDDEILLETVSDTLTELGAEVDCATDSVTAVEMTEKSISDNNEYRIIIIDWDMADSREEDIKSKIVKATRNSKTSVMVSTYAKESIREEALLTGADGIVSKPVFKSNAYSTISGILGIDKVDKTVSAPEKKNYNGIRLLVAEDNDFNWEIATTLLSMYNIESERAENGEICLEKLLNAVEGYYDMVLMDIQMPVMNGYETAKAIRNSESEKVRNIPIIAMTADAFADDIQKCIDSGMNAHVSKPVDIGNLLGTIDKQRKS